MLRTLGTELWSGGRLLLSREGVFGEDGTLSDEKVREQLRTSVQEFAAFAEAARSSRRGPSA